MTTGYKRFTRSDAFLLWKLMRSKGNMHHLIQKGTLLSEKWIERIELIDRPLFESLTSDAVWTESESILNKLYFHDRNSPDIRAIDQWVPSPWNRLSLAAFLCRAGFNTYPFNLSEKPRPSYFVEMTDAGFKVRTAADIDIWVYLISRKRYPESYCLEFDYCPETPTDEPLQIDLCAESLADRLRFVLKKNEKMRFDVWEDGFGLYHFDKERWNEISVPCSLPLRSYSHIKCIAHRNIFVIFVDDNYVMGVRIKGFSHYPAHFCLIFWSGKKDSKPISFEIKNPHISY